MASRPFFILCLWGNMDIQSILEQTLPGLGYELVDYVLTTNGDLRVFIDKEGGITIDDCTQVSNHLSRVLMVEDVDYQRLEISSPGLDRPLKKPEDYVRFAGQLVKIKTRLPVDGQKSFVGRLEGMDQNHIVRLILQTEHESKQKNKMKQCHDAMDRTIQIELSNIDKARLQPEF